MRVSLFKTGFTSGKIGAYPRDDINFEYLRSKIYFRCDGVLWNHRHAIESKEVSTKTASCVDLYELHQHKPSKRHCFEGSPVIDDLGKIQSRQRILRTSEVCKGCNYFWLQFTKLWRIRWLHDLRLAYLDHYFLLWSWQLRLVSSRYPLVSLKIFAKIDLHPWTFQKLLLTDKFLPA